MSKLITFFFLLLSVASTAQNCKLSGRIVNLDGNAIPFASIYISSIAKGSMANIDGEFSLTVPCNSYTIQFQSLGFEKKALKIDISSENEQQIILKNICLLYTSPSPRDS